MPINSTYYYVSPSLSQILARPIKLLFARLRPQNRSPESLQPIASRVLLMPMSLLDLEEHYIDLRVAIAG